MQPLLADGAHSDPARAQTGCSPAARLYGSPVIGLDADGVNAGGKHSDSPLIENAGPGMALVQDLWRDPPQGMTRPLGQNPEGSKTDRMVAQSAKVEAGHVHLPTNAIWLGAFLLELLAFPAGRHDDQVDSVSQFLNWTARAKNPYANMPVGMVAPKIFCNGVQI